MRNKLFLVALIACVALIGCEKAAEARGRCKTRTTVIAAEENHNIVSVGVDAPNLVKIGKGWTLGAEGGKEVIKNVFYNDNAFIEADKGYFALVKFTYTGCLVNCEE